MLRARIDSGYILCPGTYPFYLVSINAHITPSCDCLQTLKMFGKKVKTKGKTTETIQIIEDKNFLVFFCDLMFLFFVLGLYPTLNATMSVSPGIRVVRGPDWSWENQDGGEGCTGTIIETTKRNAIGTVMVRWDNGKQSNYRIGHLNAYDLRIIDNGPIGVRHQLHDCNFCHQESSGQNDGNDISLRGITGIRWSCASCTEVHLCTKHYMSTNEKCINHQFLR